jgi:transcriptional regulator with XRE-family HTH domain
MLPGMSARIDPVQRGKELGVAAHQRFIREVRDARLAMGKSQASAARQAGVDRAVWSRIERGERTAITFSLAGRMAAAVGLDLTMQLFPADRLLRDEGQLRLLLDHATELGPDWAWRSEVLVGPPPERRAWDRVGRHRRTGLVVKTEAETRIGDVQALQRRLAGKREADPGGRLILVVRDSRHNRLAVRQAQEALGTTFPIEGRYALARLRAGLDPGGDALVLMDWRAENATHDRRS